MSFSRIARSTLVAMTVGALFVGATAAVSQADPVDRVRELATGPDQQDPEPQQEPPTRDERTMRVGTFNITGSIHTAGGDQRRTARIARQLRQRGIGLMGLQEVQPDQLRVLRDRMPGYRFSPGLVEEDQGFQLQVAWNRERFDLRDRGHIRTPFNDAQRRTPWVRLRHEATGRIIHVIDVHNPSKGQEGNRDAATRRQVDLYQRLRDRGAVLLVGDANEKAEWFCTVTGRTDARAANGGSHGKRGCRPPDPASIDWLMGGGDFAWRGYRRDDVGTSDHAIHTSRLTLR
jgi:endonuclease/exonuclease/phosphatase family metal-dependent hydrolase